MMLEDELEFMGIHVVGPANNLKSALQLAELSILDGAIIRPKHQRYLRDQDR